MGKATPPSRQLRYDDFESMLADADQLLSGGYKSAGNWTLGQAASHVADWMRFPMDGYPKPPLLARPVFWIIKVTMARKMANDILTNGFKPGIPTAPQTVPDADTCSDEDGVRQLHEVVQRFREYDGPLIPSPLFGEQDRDRHTRVSLLHAAHHFGYFVANE